MVLGHGGEVVDKHHSSTSVTRQFHYVSNRLSAPHTTNMTCFMLFPHPYITS